MRRLFYFLVIIIVIVLVVALGYYFGYRKEATPGITPQTGGPGGLPTTPGQRFPTAPLTPSPQPESVPQTQPALAAGEKFGQASESLVLDFVVRKDGTTVLIQPDGKVVRLSPRGQATVVSPTVLPELVAAWVSASGEKVVAMSGSYESPRFHLFDAERKQWEELPEVTESPAWAPDEEKLAYVSRDAAGVGRIEVATLATSTRDAALLLSLRSFDLVLRWGAQDALLISERASAAVKGAVLALNPKSGTLSVIREDVSGGEVIWDAKGGRGLLFASAAGERGGVLQLVDAEGVAARTLSFLTLVSKCAFGEKSLPQGARGANAKAAAPAPAPIPVLYCAVPRDQEALQGAALPDDYAKRALFTADDFYEVNLENGATSVLFTNESEYLDASNVKLANGNLYFVNRYDQKLYAVALAQ